MDWVALGKKTAQAVKAYRYVLLVLFIGIVLMRLPTGNTKTNVQQAVPQSAPQSPQSATQTGLEESLSQILSKMEGAGKVQVLLTEAEGEKILYQTDVTKSQTDSTNDQRQQTVLISGQDRSESGLIRQIEPPVYLGAIVLCQGADSASVRLAITQAVSDATGLSTDKISVLKMK